LKIIDYAIISAIDTPPIFAITPLRYATLFIDIDFQP